jgi:hypothetical protein
MASELITQLKNIRDKINNLPVDDEKAKELESLIGKSIEIISKLKNPHHDFFDSRRQTALHDLEDNLNKHVKGYWEADTKIVKISEFSRARNDVNFVLNRILSTFKR